MSSAFSLSFFALSLSSLLIWLQHDTLKPPNARGAKIQTSPLQSDDRAQAAQNARGQYLGSLPASKKEKPRSEWGSLARVCSTQAPGFHVGITRCRRKNL